MPWEAIATLLLKIYDNREELFALGQQGVELFNQSVQDVKDLIAGKDFTLADINALNESIQARRSRIQAVDLSE